ncbi:hypothetical protein Q7P37_005636 [Cladosporium fusiforme]
MQVTDSSASENLPKRTASAFLENDIHETTEKISACMIPNSQPQSFQIKDSEPDGVQAGERSQQLVEPQPFDRLVETYDRRQHHFTAIKRENSTKRMDLEHRLLNLQEELDRFRDSVGALMSKVAGKKPLDNSVKPRARHRKLQDAVYRDLRAIEERCQHLETLSVDIRAHDKRLEAREMAFDNVCRVIFHQLSAHGLSSSADHGDNDSLKSTSFFESASSVATTTPTAPELSNYFFAFSHLRDMSERIDDLSGEQGEQKERRGLLEDQGYTLDENEEEFSSRWQSTMKPAERNYNEARLALENAQKLCADANIEIPGWASMDPNVRAEAEGDPKELSALWAASDPTNLSDRWTPTKTANVVFAIPPENITQEKTSPGSSSSSSYPAADDKVSHWMQSVGSTILDDPRDISSLATMDQAMKASERIAIRCQHDWELPLTKSRSHVELPSHQETNTVHRRSASCNAIQTMNELDAQIWESEPIGKTPRPCI